MTQHRTDIRKIGSLQDIGLPYVSVYAGPDGNDLFVFVRIHRLPDTYATGTDDDRRHYYAAHVDPDEVLQYIEGRKGLLDIMLSRPVTHAWITGDTTHLDPDDDIVRNFRPDSRMIRHNVFDPEMCDDDIDWIESCISDMTRPHHGAPLRRKAV